MHGLPDNRFDRLDLLDLVKVVEADLAAHDPAVVLTHHGGDLNIDHQLVNRAVLTATRPTGAASPMAVHQFEVPSSTEWAFQRFEPVFRPNLFVAVGETLETKVAAMAAYESEARPFPHPRSADALRALAHRWGAATGLGAAEAFETVRDLRPAGASGASLSEAPVEPHRRRARRHNRPPRTSTTLS